LKIKKLLLAITLITAAPITWSQGALRAGPDQRAGEWNFSLEPVYIGSEGISGKNGSSLDIKDEWGLGFNIGYNYTNNWALSFEVNFLKPRYDAIIVPEEAGLGPQKFSHKMDMINGLLKGTYNFVDGPVTPFIDLSVGFSYLDSNVADRPPTTGCWWDPWWGYVCQSFSSTYSDTRFNYGGGIGLRWDLSPGMFLRASYSLMKIDLGKSDNPTFDVGRLDIGWRY